MSAHPEPRDPHTPAGAGERLAPGRSVPGISSWVLDTRLGGGGFGEVWLVRHEWNPDEPPRAVKFCTDPAARTRLVAHEKKVVVRVMRHTHHHPNIVPLLDCNLDGEFPWLMYEFVAGGTLAAAVPAWKELSPPRRFRRAVKTLCAVADALATCHRLAPPIVHRDIKPHNILMAGAVPRITDFGLSAAKVPTLDNGELIDGVSVALPSQLCGYGTDGYSPPQQRLGCPPDPRDDVYALGVMAYQMLLCDLERFPGTSAADIPHELGAPRELVALILSSVADDHERRPPDAGEWVRQLTDLLGKKPEPPAGSLPTVPPVALPVAAPPVAARPVAPATPRAPVSPPPAVPQPAAGETCEVAIAAGVRMIFCWVPPGRATLGAPPAQRHPDAAPEHEFVSPGFWLGKYTVTQTEWAAVTGNNPSEFNGERDNKAKGMDTGRFPVECVSWDMICRPHGFLDQANAHGGILKALGKVGRLRLPHEDEWEYACRGGRGNAHAFYFGDRLNGTEANSDGAIPFGTTAAGRSLGRPCPVDDTNDGKYAPHPWGLMHMHGNVWEWCDNTYDRSKRRVVRGGCWYGDSRFCAAAHRGSLAPGFSGEYVGFRLCFRID